ncbi:MAG: hypothetical protein ACTSRG_15645 [Candidatus Helarchaeota archaeon]
MFDYVQEIAILPSIHPNEEPVRHIIETELKSMGEKYKIDDFGNLHVLSQNMILLSAHLDKQAPPYYKDLGDKIQGKLDDALGLGII